VPRWELPLFPPTPDFMAASEEEKGGGWRFPFVSFLCHSRSFDVLSFVISLIRSTSLGLGRGECKVTPPRGQRKGNGLYLISPLL